TLLPPLPTPLPYTTLFRSLAHTPAVDTPIRMSAGLRGSISTELMPGCSPPATPIHCRRSAMRHSGSFSDHEVPPSSERNSPPGKIGKHTSELQSPYDLVCR